MLFIDFHGFHGTSGEKIHEQFPPICISISTVTLLFTFGTVYDIIDII
jgi:hypothetical protein